MTSVPLEFEPLISITQQFFTMEEKESVFKVAGGDCNTENNLSIHSFSLFKQ